MWLSWDVGDPSSAAARSLKLGLLFLLAAKAEHFASSIAIREVGSVSTRRSRPTVMAELDSIERYFADPDSEDEHDNDARIAVEEYVDEYFLR